MSPNRATAEKNVPPPAEVLVGQSKLPGFLRFPDSPPSGVVLFAHGSGSSRRSVRNQYVADRLREAGLATLLMDLLTPAEEAVDDQTRELRFDLSFLAERLCEAIDWLNDLPLTTHLPVGLFGASTGGGAALIAATRRPDRVAAVVSRGGRPDLADEALPHVACPTLLLVGGADRIVIDLNRKALARLGAPIQELTIIPDAGHLFEEPGALEEVSRRAADWFDRHLRSHSAPYDATATTSPP